MARTPTPATAAATDPAAGADSGADDGTGADAGADAGDTGDTGDTVLVTIAKGVDGGYIVYAGDEPDDDDGEGASADDDAAGGAGVGGAAGGAGGSGAATAGTGEEGQHVDSIGQALKAALDILNESASSAGAPGSSDDQFAAGYGGDQSPTPATTKGGRGGLKYPPATAG